MADGDENSQADEPAAALRASFEHDRIARCLLDPRARVHFANRRARDLFASGAGLSIRNGALVAADENAHARLLAALRNARRRRRIVVLPREAGPPALLRLEPIEGAAFTRATFWTRGPIRISAFSVVAAHYNLSPHQARVAAEVIAGRSVEQIARKRGVAVETVRSHLKAINEKTGVSSQAGLVAAFLQFLDP